MQSSFFILYKNKCDSSFINTFTFSSETSSDDDDDSSESSDDDDDSNSDSDASLSTLSGEEGHYYGGYGHCYICGHRGHWAPGCPDRY